MKPISYELDLWEQLQLAQQMPEAIDLAQLLALMEAMAVQLPEAQRLQFAGDVLLRMAELCATRADVLVTNWEEAQRDPIVERSFFADVVRQTMEPAPVRKRRTKSAGSIAAPVGKAAVLAMVDQLEAAATDAET
jgi:hypothetical protein